MLWEIGILSQLMRMADVLNVYVYHQPVLYVEWYNLWRQNDKRDGMSNLIARCTDKPLCKLYLLNWYTPLVLSSNSPDYFDEDSYFTKHGF